MKEMKERERERKITDNFRTEWECSGTKEVPRFETRIKKLRQQVENLCWTFDAILWLVTKCPGGAAARQGKVKRFWRFSHTSSAASECHCAGAHCYTNWPSLTGYLSMYVFGRIVYVSPILRDKKATSEGSRNWQRRREDTSIIE